MKIEKLKLYVPPVVEAPVCAACKTFAPEVLVPDGDGAKQMCWMCAHHVVEHDVCIEHAHAAECECMPDEIYPASVMALRSGYEPSKNAGAWPAQTYRVSDEEVKLRDAGYKAPLPAARVVQRRWR